MTKKQLAQAQKLGQKQTTWYVVSKPAPAWVGEDETQLIRPHLTLVMDIGADMVRQMEITESPPDSPELVKVVLDAMLKPGGGAKGKFRPTMIQTEDTAVLAKLQPLTEIGVYCEQKAQPALATYMLRELEEHLMGREYVPGLQHVPSVTKAMLRDFYAAAAAYFKAAPWEKITDGMPIAICMPPEADPVYLSIMGNAEETFGLALYEDYEDLAALYSGMSNDMLAEGTRWVSVMYDYPHYMPFEDLDAIAANSWPVAAPDAYPLFVGMLPAEEDFDLPSVDEIELATAALNAVPHFLKNYFNDETGPDWEAGEVGYPAGSDDPDFTLCWVDNEELEEAQFEEFMAQGQALVDEFIEDWNVNEDNYGEAMKLGALLYAFVQISRLQAADNAELDEDDLVYIEEVCWEIGSIIMDFADFPLDVTMFQGPPLFVEEYREEWADSEEDVENYKIMWANLGGYVTVVSQQMAMLAEEGEDWDDVVSQQMAMLAEEGEDWDDEEWDDDWDDDDWDEEE